MLRLVVLAALFALSLAACDSDGGDGTVSDAPAAGSVGTLVLDWSSRTLAPVDPATLELLPGFSPLAMGHWASNYVSPDGRVLASVIGPTQEPRANLHVVDLKDWTEMFVLDEPKGELSIAVWAPDSQRLYIAGGLRDWSSGQSIWAVDIEDRSGRKLTDLEFWTDRLDVSPDGRTLYVFAFELADPRAFTVGGDPFLVALDSNSGKEKARVGLPGMLMGQTKEQGGPYGESYAMYNPGRALSPDGRRYYIAHAEDDEITVVDLERMAVEKTAVPARPRSLFEKLFDELLAGGVAEAKGGPSSGKAIRVSGDGTRLFVTGGRDHEIAADSRGYEPVGLRVLEADTLEIIAEHDGISGIEVSPDGKLLFATGWSHQWTQTGPTELTPDNYQGSGLKVIDARTGTLMNDFAVGRIFESVVPSAGGRFAYLVTQQPEYRGQAWKQEGCPVPCKTVTVYDVSGGRAITERIFNTHIVELFAAGPAPK